MKTRKEIGDTKGHRSIYVVERFVNGKWYSTCTGDGSRRWAEAYKMLLEEHKHKKKFRIVLYVRAE